MCGVLFCVVGHFFIKDTKMLEMSKGLSVFHWIAGLSKPVQQYMFIKFTVVLQECIFGHNSILKNL